MESEKQSPYVLWIYLIYLLFEFTCSEVNMKVYSSFWKPYFSIIYFDSVLDFSAHYTLVVFLEHAKKQRAWADNSLTPPFCATTVTRKLFYVWHRSCSSQRVGEGPLDNSSLQFDLLNAKALNTSRKEKIHCSLFPVNLALSYNNNGPMTLEWNRGGGAGHTLYKIIPTKFM